MVNGRRGANQRLDQTGELIAATEAAQNRMLDQPRAAQERRLKDRQEVLD